MRIITSIVFSLNRYSVLVLTQPKMTTRSIDHYLDRFQYDTAQKSTRDFINRLLALYSAQEHLVIDIFERLQCIKSDYPEPEAFIDKKI